MKRGSALYLFLCGAWFGQVQVAGLFLLQAYYTAAIPAYILQTTAWLTGAVVGVWVGSRLSWWYWPLCGLYFSAFYQVWTNQLALPIEGSWLILFSLALPAGSVFQEQLPYWEDSGAMFGCETIGFIAGVGLATVVLMHSGIGFCRLLPLETLILTFVGYRLKRRAAS